MFLAMSFIPAGDTAAKLLTGTYAAEPIFVSWSRFFVGTLLILPFAPRGAWRLLRNWRIWVRAATLATGISCIQMALKVEEIATVFGAFFVGPLVSYVLAVIFLGEPVTKARSILIFIGFLGVLIVVQPGMSASTGVLWAFTAGCCYGTFLTMSRWLGHLGTPLEMTFSQLIISSLLLLPFGISHLPAPSTTITALTFASATFSLLGNLLLLYAYKHAPATRLAPLVYFQLVAAVVLGLLVFGDLPDIWTWVGITVILSAGLTSVRLR